MTWTQVYDPAGHWWLSTLIAAMPIIVLLGLLAGLKVRADLCAVAGAATAVTVAIVAFKMPAVLAVSSFFYGSAFGLLLVVGGSFAATQWFWANHVDSNLVDISAGVTSLVVTLFFLRVWRPRKIWRFADEAVVDASSARRSIQHYPARQIARAWMPFAILSIFVLCWGLPSIKTALNQATTPSFKVVMADGKPRPGPPGWDWPYLHGKVSRTAPVVAKPTAEAARFDFNWLTATGTGCFLAAIVAGLLLGLRFSRILSIFGRTLVRLRFAIIAMTCMLGIGYVTRYSGMDAVLGLAFTRTS